MPTIHDMKSVSLSERCRFRTLHVEAPGCIINIRFGLTTTEGRPVTSISISADGDRYSGEQAWWVETEDHKVPGMENRDGFTVRVVREAA